jgi:sigma-B regulation protein RsbU (phosphoserine phosphatase)
VIREGPNRLGLVIADITDKGLPASLFMVFVRSALRASITRRASPSQVLMNANRVICQDSYRGLFATLFYARLDTDSGELTYINAGHPPALVYRRAQNELQLLVRTGMALGVEESTIYTQQSIQLDPGDFLLFYTDGVIEAINPAQQEFGLERLKDVARGLRDASSSGLLDGLERALAVYTAPLAPQDDVTLMVVRRDE